MKTVVPSYYPAFSCIAGACKHSCCIGWEIGIDPATAERYTHESGAFGDRLRQAMYMDADGDTAMRLTADARCPFLSESGLCDIYTTLGEDALCQICTDHPRYRAFFSHRIEMGLGGCCEAAASLIVLQEEPTAWIVLHDDGASEDASAEEVDFFTSRAALIAIAQDRSRSLTERCDAILQAVNRTRPPLSDTALFTVSHALERLDPAWDAVLARLHKPSLTVADDLPFEHLLVYFLWRHTPLALDDGRFAERVAFAVHSTRLLMRLHGDRTKEDLIELFRAYSAEIEYSDDNLEQLFSLF